MYAGADLLQVADLHLRAGERVLVSELNWAVLPGQCWCVIGRNGAGKSTLLQTLVGMRVPYAGTVRLKSRALSDWPLLALARERAYLPQGRSDAFGYRVIESILTARHPYHANGYWDSDADYRAAQASLQALDVADLAERDIRTLSGGERQRVAIAAVVAQDTQLILLDEPANALDLGHQVSVMALLAKLCRDSGKTVVMVSHDLNLARGVASHALLLMDEGRWHAGPVAEVMQASLLSACLGHPIEAVQHGERIIFIPGKGTQHE
ncbi:MAG: ABC transporter ATP-binding protein [Pseudomonadota bacterium]